MLSGLTTQMSSWMGKKGEDSAQLPTEEKITSPVAEGEVGAEKKNGQGTGGKLEMLAGVKSQMSGWLSGGIAGFGRSSAAAANEGEPLAPQEPTESQIAPTQQDAAGEEIKDDDASSATGGADSVEGTPTGEKQPFSSVSTAKALLGAKNLGGFFYSAVNKAGKTVAEAGAKIKKTVEENRLIESLNKEQEAFNAAKQPSKGEAVAPWVGAPNEDLLREECLALSTDRRNFLRTPPEGVEFDWDFDAALPIAKAILALDPNLENMRFELVPKTISEEQFWRNYFYRVSLLRQSHELNTMANQDPNMTSGGSVDQPQVQVTTGQETNETMTAISNNTADSPGHEFVSDSMRVSDTDLEEVREGMKKLGMQPPKA